MARTVAERADVVPRLAEVFRQHGFEGASLARLCQGSGLGKGSLYHFFPGGKDEMADAVLAHIDAWFGRHVFAPLRGQPGGRAGIDAMFDAVSAYFQSGQKVCIVGLFALGQERDRYGARVQAYFAQWVAALAAALEQDGKSAPRAVSLAEDVVAGIQGALVLSRALARPELFARALADMAARLR
ncbi:MAG: TetR/AcrR family transcriptional regulator [Pseudomonadota bacterium]